MKRITIWTAIFAYAYGKFDCTNYKTTGDKPTKWCENTACLDCKNNSPYAPQCMEDKYVSSGQCEQTHGMPLDACRVVVGVKPGHTLWCQLEACPYSMISCSGSCDLGKQIVKDFPVCKVAGDDPTPAEECWSFSSTQSCQSCSQIDKSTHKCKATGGECYKDKAACSKAEEATKPKPCFVFSASQSCTACTDIDKAGKECNKPITGTCYRTKDACSTAEEEYKKEHKNDDEKGCWVSDQGNCVLCKEVTQNQCTSKGWAVCKPTKKDCMGGGDDKNSCYARNGWGGSARCTRCPSGNTSGTCSNFGSTKCFSTITECKEFYGESDDPTPAPEPDTTAAPPTKAPPPTKEPPHTTAVTTTEENNDDPKACYAAANTWQMPVQCSKCEEVQSNACTSRSWAPCHKSMKACVDETMKSIRGNKCDRLSPNNTLTGFTRPKFLGPNCYDSTYGSGFGPNWKPTGKTAIEKHLPTPADFYLFVKVMNEPIPRQEKWGLVNDDDSQKAATAVYENFVCALEYLASLNKKFDAPLDNTVDKLFNSGDATTDKIELAAFFAHKMKETGRLATFEEAAGNAYCDSTNAEFPCSAGAEYHGRGAVQISWNYNYGAFSDWLFGDKNVLLKNPEKVDPEGPMGFIAAIWFWMSQRQFTSNSPIAGWMSTHDAIVHWNDGKLNSAYTKAPADYDKYAGFGLTTNIINGGLECASTGTNGHLWRVAYFLTMLHNVGIKVDGMDDPAKCAQNALCHSIWRGCTSQGTGSCKPSDGFCKDSVMYWSSSSPSCIWGQA